MSNLTGTDKSVILLMTIGEDRAAEVFKHLSQREVQTLSAAMANVTQISNKQLTDVLAEFEQEAEQFAALNINANDYLRSVLVKALGEERAASLLEDILETRDTASGIETLNFMEPQSAADLIRDEHPQIIATILVHLKRAQAADILALFDERLRHDVMLRIATFGGVQPAALAELTEVLNGLLDGQNKPLLPPGVNSTASWRRKSSTRCSCSRIWWMSTIAAFSDCCRKWIPNRC